MATWQVNLCEVGLHVVHHGMGLQVHLQCTVESNPEQCELLTLLTFLYKENKCGQGKLAPIQVILNRFACTQKYTNNAQSQMLLYSTCESKLNVINIMNCHLQPW